MDQCAVLQEMQRLDADSNVYKLIGPVLVKQDQEEAKQNVQKRIDYITTELWVHIIHLSPGSEKPGFFFEKAQPSGFWGFSWFFIWTSSARMIRERNLPGKLVGWFSSSVIS